MQTLIRCMHRQKVKHWDKNRIQCIAWCWMVATKSAHHTYLHFDCSVRSRSHSYKNWNVVSLHLLAYFVDLVRTSNFSQPIEIDKGKMRYMMRSFTSGESPGLCSAIVTVKICNWEERVEFVEEIRMQKNGTYNVFLNEAEEIWGERDRE